MGCYKAKDLRQFWHLKANGQPAPAFQRKRIQPAHLLLSTSSKGQCVSFHLRLCRETTGSYWLSVHCRRTIRQERDTGALGGCVFESSSLCGTPRPTQIELERTGPTARGCQAFWSGVLLPSCGTLKPFGERHSPFSFLLLFFNLDSSQGSLGWCTQKRHASL